MKKNLILPKKYIRTLKNKFVNILLQYQKNVYIDKLYDIVNTYLSYCN